MQIKSILIIIILLTNNIYASNYSRWLNDFKSILKVGNDIDKEELDSISVKLQLKPDATENDYSNWLIFFNQQTQVGPIITETEKKLLDFSLLAKPNNCHNGYLKFLYFFDKKIKLVGPVLDQKEYYILSISLKAKPENIISNNYSTFQQQFFTKYELLKKRFGKIDSKESRLLNLFMQAKPSGQQEIKITDPLFDQLKLLLLHSPVKISNALSYNNYILSEKMVEVIETFYLKLKNHANTTNDEKLQYLYKKIQDLE